LRGRIHPCFYPSEYLITETSERIPITFHIEVYTKVVERIYISTE